MSPNRSSQIELTNLPLVSETEPKNIKLSCGCQIAAECLTHCNLNHSHKKIERSSHISHVHPPEENLTDEEQDLYNESYLIYNVILPVIFFLVWDYR